MKELFKMKHFQNNKRASVNMNDRLHQIFK